MSGNRLPAVAALAGLLVVNVYRAATQSITYDEAVAYLHFTSGSLGHVFTEYAAGNHVLFTLLSWLSSALLGVSEFSLRLPIVAAGALFFSVSLPIARRAFGRRLVGVLGIGARALKPYVLHFLSAARGHGL